MFDNLYENLNQTTIILLSLAIILIAGFLVTRITKFLRLPNVSGFIIAGVLIGPSVLNMIPVHIIDGMEFLSDIALAFIAFGVGKFFKLEVLKQTGFKVILITLGESLVAGIFVTLAMRYIFAFDWSFSLLLGAIATATAPASTMMTINQYHARGNFVNTLLQVVALDDVVCLFAFSIVTTISESSTAFSPVNVLMPIIYNIAALAVGFMCGFILSKLLNSHRSNDNRLILTVAILLGISGLCTIVDISPLLSCMIFSATYINLTEDKELFKQINNFTPPIMSLFFIVSGMNLDLSVLATVGITGIAYFIIRIIGKYAGTYFTCLACDTDKNILNYLGFALIPQAGVAIGLAFLGQRLLPADTGNLLMTIILSSSVLYELIGPVCAKIALIKSGAISKEALAANAPPYTVKRHVKNS